MLLILAGVSISLVVGSDGVLGKATNAVEQNEKGTAEQEVKLAVAECQINYYDAWVGDQNVKKSTYYTQAVFNANCTSGTVTLTNSLTDTAAADTGTVTVKYVTDSGAEYNFSINVSNGKVSETSGS